MSEFFQVEKEHFGICLFVCDHSQLEFFFNAYMKLWGIDCIPLFQTIRELLHIAVGMQNERQMILTLWKTIRYLLKLSFNSKILLLDIY